MKVAGIDVGSRMTKAVIMDEKMTILGESVIPTGADLELAARKALDEALRQLSPADRGQGSRVSQSNDLSAASVSPGSPASPPLSPSHPLDYVAVTGFGRYQVPFRDVQITDITCHARGAIYYFPKTRNVLDIGAQTSRAMKIEGNGRVRNFKTNDRCAAGAGRFLERIAKALELNLEEIGEISLRSTDPQPISSICAVLAESEVINHITEGKKIEDILKGAHQSICDRTSALLRQVGIEEEITLTGGVTKNIGMVRALEEKLGKRVNVPERAEQVGAIGAAALAVERLKKRQLTPETQGSSSPEQASTSNEQVGLPNRSATPLKR